MSTRSAIARPDAGFAQTGDFTGRYHHWDGYPQGLGKTLYRTLNQKNLLGKSIAKATKTSAKRNAVEFREAVLHHLLDEHTGGFSSINGVHFTTPDPKNPKKCKHCWRDIPPKDEPHDKYGLYCNGHGKVECHCHPESAFADGRKPERDWTITHKNASECGCEWVYVVDAKAGKMYVLSSVNEDGSKMIGMFGFGNPDAKWQPVAVVDLDAPEPDWKRVEYGLALDVWEHYRTLPHHAQYAKGKDDGHAYCPNGHEFYEGWRNPGDVCEGKYVNAQGSTSGSGPFHYSGCGHVFTLPATMLTGTEPPKVLPKQQKALATAK